MPPSSWGSYAHCPKTHPNATLTEYTIHALRSKHKPAHISNCFKLPTGVDSLRNGFVWNWCVRDVNWTKYHEDTNTIRTGWYLYLPRDLSFETKLLPYVFRKHFLVSSFANRLPKQHFLREEITAFWKSRVSLRYHLNSLNSPPDFSCFKD